MKKTIFVLTLLTLGFAACAAPIPGTLAPTMAVNTQSAPSVPATEPVTEGKIPGASFESQTYINDSLGFALDYPIDWTVKESQTGSRGSQSLLLSSPEIADLVVVPEGETRISIDVNQWDPKNDLAAYIEMRKTAWKASSFTIGEAQPLTLDLGLSAVQITVQTSEGLTVPYLFAVINDQCVTVSGEGDLALVHEIMQRLRPVSIH